MNLAPTLKWASMVLWHLEHPESRSRQGVTNDRLTERLGWLRDFAPGIRQWQGCQEVISTALTFINQQGLFRGVAQQFQNLVADLADHPISQQLAETMYEFLHENEHELRPKERLPMSTEILKSGFSLYKQLEKQHSKSGFTSLLLTFPTLLRETTPKEVNASFQRVKVADVKQWVKKHLPSTLTSKRQIVFKESRIKTKTKTPNRATSELTAA